mmetsp:Transcript_1776/g.5030  ORF Transcript_1776/g.5030 Transcript_1776/m.5030 type:complete len:148 (-) Transcript_1776:134-577(-)
MQIASEPIHKALTIKVGTVKRTKREYEGYLQEEADQRKKIENMKEKAMDEYDIKKQVEVLNDTLTVIPDTRQRLLKYSQELHEFLGKNFEGFSTEPREGEEKSEEAKRKLVLEGRQYLQEVPVMLSCDPFDAEDGADAGTGGPDDEF